MEIIKATVECAFCGHELEGQIRFGLDLVRCANCMKFVKVETFARVQRVVVQKSIEVYSQVIDSAEVV